MSQPLAYVVTIIVSTLLRCNQGGSSNTPFLYVGYNTVYCVYGSLFNDTIQFSWNGKTFKFTTNQLIKNEQKGYIQFIRQANGVCKILRFVESDEK